jgi:Protein of unknown function (DUF3179)
MKTRRGFAWLAALMASLAVALFFLGYPNYVIRPQRHQGARELQAALAVLRFQHVAELLCAAVALVALLMYLRTAPRRALLIGASAAAVTVLACAALSRMTIYEVMFHAVGAPAFESVRASKLAGSDRVLTVAVKSDARGFPIRAIAYHHIVNEVVGGVPIVVTY